MAKNGKKGKFIPFKKKDNKKKNYKSIPRFTGMGASKIAKLRYISQNSLDAPIGGIASYVFRANDLYDPDVTGAGHQPMGFDNLMAWYDHFTVVGAKITVRPAMSGSVNVVPCYYGIFLSDSGSQATTSSNVTHLLESKYNGGYKIAGQLQQQEAWRNKVSKTFSAKKFFHKSVVNAADFRGSDAASPNEMAYFEVWAASINANDPGSINFVIQIDYVAVFTEPKRLDQS